MVQSSVDTPVLQASMVGPSESASIVHLQHDEAEAQHNMASEQEEFRSACASPTIQTSELQLLFDNKLPIRKWSSNNVYISNFDFICTFFLELNPQQF